MWGESVPGLGPQALVHPAAQSLLDIREEKFPGLLFVEVHAA